MMRMSRIFTHFSKGWIAILATVIFLLFMAFVLPGQAVEAKAVGGGVGSPDTSFWYTPEDLYYLADVYGEAGRVAYVRARWTFDLIYPLVYALFLITTVSWLFAYGDSVSSRWRKTNLVPFFSMVFDYLENCATSFVMVRYPQLSPLAATAAPFLTLVKWILVLCSFLLLVIGVVIAIRTRLTYRQTSI